MLHLSVIYIIQLMILQEKEWFFIPYFAVQMYQDQIFQQVFASTTFVQKKNQTEIETIIIKQQYQY